MLCTQSLVAKDRSLKRLRATSNRHGLLLSSAVALAFVSVAFAGIISATTPLAADDGYQIRPWEENARYWQYRGRPVLLLGGTKDDSLFQIPDLRQHLDDLKAVGGNYIRNTMSDRPDHDFEVYAYKQLASGKYDLGQWNDEYWTRFENMLQWTAEREIIVQIEVWDRFDYSDSKGSERWLRHPYNPKNNVNYTSDETGLKTTYTKHPGQNEQPFFYSVPSLQNNEVLLRYQVAKVDRMLESSLKYGHVLYCMDNETSGDPEWAKFWAKHIRSRAAKFGATVQLTEMWDQWDIKGGHHKETFDHPELYTFIDVSQNNHNRGQQHWDNLQWVRKYTADEPRPINTVKIYGADSGRYGSGRDGQERFWRNILGGAASTRFHRPDSGLGSSETAQKHIRSMRMLTERLDIFHCTPDVDSRRLGDREPNEAYLSCIEGEQYALYFPDGGVVTLDLSDARGEFDIRWLDILESRWADQSHTSGGKSVTLRAPGTSHWACLLQRVD